MHRIPTHSDYEAYKVWRERIDAQHQRAILSAYQQKSKPTIGGKIALYALMALLITVAVVLGLVAQ